MSEELIKGAVLGAIFLILLFGVAKACSLKFEPLLHLLRQGALLEFTTKPGGISLATFVIVAAIGFVFAFVTETKEVFCTFFNVHEEERGFSPGQAVAIAICAMVLDFLFIAWMNKKKH